MAPFGEPGGRLVYRGHCEKDEGGSGGVVSLSICGSSVKGTWRQGFLVGDPERYVEEALETGISFHRGPAWGTWRRARLPGT